MKSHANWSPASAQQSGRVLARSDGDNMHLLTYVDEVLELREVCRPFDKAPHAPGAGDSTDPVYNEKL